MTNDLHKIDLGDKEILRIETSGRFCDYHNDYEYDWITFVFTDGTELEFSANSAERIDVQWRT